MIHIGDIEQFQNRKPYKTCSFQSKNSRFLLRETKTLEKTPGQHPQTARQRHATPPVKEKTAKRLQDCVSAVFQHGADEGNRTPVASLGSWSSTIEPHPHNRLIHELLSIITNFLPIVKWAFKKSSRPCSRGRSGQLFLPIFCSFPKKRAIFQRFRWTDFDKSVQWKNI